MYVKILMETRLQTKKATRMWQQATAGYDIITESIFIVFDDDFVNSVREGNKRPAHWQNQEEICVYFHLVELKFLFLLKQGISVAASVMQYKCSAGGMFCYVICSLFFFVNPSRWDKMFYCWLTE